MNDDKALETIQKDITDNDVFLYMKGTPEEPMCGFSAQVIRILDRLDVDYAARNVLEDGNIREGIKKFANWPTIPQLYVKGQFVGGCDIVMEMDRKGELASVLAKAKG